VSCSYNNVLYSVLKFWLSIHHYVEIEILFLVWGGEEKRGETMVGADDHCIFQQHLVEFHTHSVHSMLLNVVHHHLSVATCTTYVTKTNFVQSQWAHIDDFLVQKHFVNVCMKFETPEVACVDQGDRWS